MSNNPWREVRWSTKHTDLIRGIRTIRAALSKWHGVTVKFQHVTGHQDDSQHYHSLPRLAQLNIDCDSAAKKTLLEMIDNPQLVPTQIFGEGWACYIPQTRKITTSPEITIRCHTHGKALLSISTEERLLLASQH